MSACRGITQLYLSLDDDEKILIVKPAVEGVTNLCATDSSRSGTLHYVLCTLQSLLSEINNPAIIGQLEPAITSLLLNKWEQSASDATVVFLIVDVLKVMAESPIARTGLQSVYYQPCFTCKHENQLGNVEASLGFST